MEVLTTHRNLIYQTIISKGEVWGNLNGSVSQELLELFYHNMDSRWHTTPSNLSRKDPLDIYSFIVSNESLSWKYLASKTGNM